MKALFIYPPSRHMIRSNVPAFVDDSTGCYPPMGLLYVASAARAGTDWDVEVLDCAAERLDEPGIEREIARRRPDFVGIQVLTFSLLDAYRVAAAAKRVRPGAHVCLGGPHVNIYPEESIGFPPVDSLVLGEGESAVVDLLRSLAGKGDLKAVPGLVLRENGAVVRTAERGLIADLDDVPSPDRGLLDNGLYHSLLGRADRITTMISSRGCPYPCLFCERPHLGKRFRARSPGSVVREMEDCVSRGIGEIKFYDDTFTIDRSRVMEICSLIARRRLKVLWDVRARVDTLDREMLERLRESGCYRLHLGIESGHPDILKALRKDIDLAKAKETFSAAKRLGFETLAYFMIGCPGEQRRHIAATVDYLLGLDADYIHLGAATPFPGTDLYRLGLAKGLFPGDYWRRYAQDPSPGFTPEVWNEHFTREELAAMIKDIYRRFYLRPGYIFRRLASVRSLAALRHQLSAGLRLLAH
ncbi:MAG: radical SAM protein [Elusimicrobia bacterium]|nr:radical SAM protein [Elusimicrobiota bacterium]